MVTNKIITGAVTYRENKGTIEWFLIRASNGVSWELPKSDVRSGESSVSAILRFLKEGLGMGVTVLEEAGRANATTSYKGNPLEQKMVFYIIKGMGKALDENGLPTKANIKVDGQWFAYSAVRRKVNLVREQKMLASANEYLKECRKKKITKKKAN